MDFTAVGHATTAIGFNKGETISWTLAGAFTGSVVLEWTRDPVACGYTVIDTQTTASTFTYQHVGDRTRWYRLRCTAIGEAETITATITEATGQVSSAWADSEGIERLQVVDGGVNVEGTLSSDSCNATNFDAGASGTAGTVDIFPTTASKGKFILSCTAQTGDTTVTLKPAAMGQATVVTIPDPGAAAGYVAMSTAALALAEVDLLQGALPANSNPSVAAVLDADKALRTTANKGEPGTGVTAVDYGDGRHFITKLTLSGTDHITIADDAALADGFLIYTFPAGEIIVHSATLNVGVTTASTESQAVNADVGLGTTAASGANNLLSANAAFENVMTGQTSSGCAGVNTVKTLVTSLVIATADAHTLNLNVAGTWANDTGGDLTADLDGTVVVNWSFMG